MNRLRQFAHGGVLSVQPRAQFAGRRLDPSGDARVVALGQISQSHPTHSVEGSVELRRLVGRQTALLRNDGKVWAHSCQDLMKRRRPSFAHSSRFLEPQASDPEESSVLSNERQQWCR